MSRVREPLLHLLRPGREECERWRDPWALRFGVSGWVFLLLGVLFVWLADDARPGNSLTVWSRIGLGMYAGGVGVHVIGSVVSARLGYVGARLDGTRRWASAWAAIRAWFRWFVWWW